MFRALKKYDFTLMITPILLSAFGIVMIYSASMVTAVVIDDLESTYYFSKQLNWFVFGFIFFMLVCFIPYKFYQKLIKPIILLSVLLLIAVLIFGETSHHATRSLSLTSFFIIQLSEFVKLVFILYLDSVYSNKHTSITYLYKYVY